MTRTSYHNKTVYCHTNNKFFGIISQHDDDVQFLKLRHFFQYHWLPFSV